MSHPSIIGWCPFNETVISQNNEFVKSIVQLTKTLDPTRPVIDSSGWVHVEKISDLPTGTTTIRIPKPSDSAISAWQTEFR